MDERASSMSCHLGGSDSGSGSDDRVDRDDFLMVHSRSPNKCRNRHRSLSTSEDLFQTSTRLVYTAGRPPWYDNEGLLRQPFMIGICGGSASGKTSVAKFIVESLDIPWVCLVSMDSFYKDLDEDQRQEANNNNYNFDHPDAFDFDLLVEALEKMRENKHVNLPEYDFTTHSRSRIYRTFYGADVIIFEGILSFHDPRVRDLLNIKVFVDTDSDVRLARRLRRDINERGRDLRGVLEQYSRFVKPSFDAYIEPTIVHADIVVPRGAENTVALDLLVQMIQTRLDQTGLNIRDEIARFNIQEEQTPNDVNTGRHDFIFFSNRLQRLLIEYALSFLPYDDVTVETPQGNQYKGRRFDTSNMCSISILRAGETLEPAIQEVCKDIRIGKILIQTNVVTGAPELYYYRLPRDIKDCHIFLLDATVATGNAAMMAMRVLLDHEVPESNIYFLSMLMSRPGALKLAYVFPKAKLITTAVDDKLDQDYYIVPGLGNFGDRYFGTG